MQVQELVNEGLKRQYKLTIEKVKVAEQLENTANKIAKKVKIQGFRPGKVPLAVVKKRYYGDIVMEAAEKIIADSVEKLLEEKKLNPVQRPEIKIETPELSAENDMEFTVAFEIYPEIKDIPYNDIKIKKIIVEVEDSKLQEALESVASKSADYIAANDDVVAEKGDVVVIDFEGSVGGELFKGGEAKEHELELGSGNFIPGFEDQLVGVKKGDEPVVKVKFPEGYFSKELSGKDAEFKIFVHLVKKKVIPAINDEFAVKFGLKDLEDLKITARKDIAHKYTQVAKMKIKKDLFDQLDQVVDVEIPEVMINFDYKQILGSDGQGKKENDYTAEELAEFKSLAKRRVKLGLVVAKISKDNEIEVANDDVIAELMNKASMYPGNEKMIIDYYKSNKNALNNVKGEIIENKVIDFILDKVADGERSISVTELDEFLKDNN